MSKHRGKIIGRSYAHKVGEILRIYDEHARSGLSNREILRRYIYPVYPICEKTFYNIINASASWKGFDVRVFFEGIAKRDLWIDSPVFWGFPSNSNVWQSAVNDYHVDNSWSENNTNAYYPLPSYSGRSKQTQTKYLQNGAYIRLKDLTISYTIPKAWISTVGIEQLKVFASGQNLWVGTKLFKYLDPDIVSTRQSNSKDNKLVGNLTSDGKAYPFSRTFSFGINLTF